MRDSKSTVPDSSTWSTTWWCLVWVLTPTLCSLPQTLVTVSPPKSMPKVELVAPLAPGLDREVLAVAVAKANRLPGDLQRLSWDIEGRPELLTGQGAHGSATLVRLLHALHDAGATGIVLPPCPNCDTQRPLHGRIEGKGPRVCKRCYENARPKVTCSGCGRDRKVSARTAIGEPLCHSCTISHPDRHDQCQRCGRVRPVAGTADRRALCKSCHRPSGPVRCSVCSRLRPCIDAKHPIRRCEECYHTARECCRCGHRRPAAALSPDGYLCEPCAAVDTEAFRHCVGCGKAAPHYAHGRCPRCSSEDYLRAPARRRRHRWAAARP